ncbi:unnamed protein product [Gordionus sp. m RMFG-2023]
MDEIFHVPQSNHYHKFRFDIWDNKITTFPGLYIISLIYSLLSSFLLNLPVHIFASPYYLRSINCWLNIGNFWLIYLTLPNIYRVIIEVNQSIELNKDPKLKMIIALTAFNLFIFPTQLKSSELCGKR